MAALVKINKLLALRNAIIQSQKNIRLISTSEKKRETITANEEVKTNFDIASNKNWVSWGFDYKDEASDRSATKASFFTSITLCIVWGTFIWSYSPDPQLRDWAQREGFLELRRREAAGLDPISRDFVDPKLIKLPTDEELGNTEIII